ncbi:eukaryotic translation initiation factor 3 subunit L isoform X2 [Folsomia candida]|uniref:eukaryotic translation initiation factor 3 subunit L isoform X2 n=1 Tax=Folsomia candida TaxID=158441 RepID=UPI000B8F772E|nr:eukaryotic translation initiation factor 3 subunit L isoform X2 [Folsomia candida]
MAYRRDSYRKDSYTRADSYRDGRIYDDEEYGGYPGHADQYSDFGNKDDFYDPRGTSTQSYSFPDAVAKFIIHLYQSINNRDVSEIENLYEIRFPQLTRDYFKEEKWPQDITHLVDDPLFTTLYRELYFRHIYATMSNSLTFSDRCNSYSNYCELFNMILTSPEPIDLTLTNQWLWEIIDEFVYQFQSFSQFRRSPRLNAEESQYFKEHTYIWSVLSVLNVLYSLIEKSNINQQLRAYFNGENAETVAGDFGKSPLYKMLGYFSLIALLRVHSMLGDYHLAVKVLENIDLHKNTMYCNVPACQITTYYYVGFAYVMMRRYADAIRTYTNALLYIQRMRQMFQAKSYQNDQVNKQTDQMYTMLAICLVLHPQSIDESINSVLQDRKYADKISKMQQGDMKEFENCFTFACPKFLSPVPPAIDASPDPSQEPLQIQKSIFMEEVAQQIYLPTIRSFLKLYTTMPVSKLAAFMELDHNTLMECLLCFKHKMHNIVWSKGVSSLDGDFMAGSEVDFYIDKDMVHIADTKVGRRYGDYFIRHIHLMDELHRALKGLKF